jgi:hypothetical protein
VSLVSRIRSLADASRPVHPDTQSALHRRWIELPARVRTEAQLLGRRTAGCEGTHGVFPRCNLACTPCYHANEANRVRTDGVHSIAEVDCQMAYLRAVRGTGQHAQLIGGEVTLLAPDDHAAALRAMISHGRKPMSMTHGDFDYEYLERLAVTPDGRRRFDLLRFAGHFDSLMLGRRGVRHALLPTRRVCRQPQALARGLPSGLDRRGVAADRTRLGAEGAVAGATDGR